MGEGVEYKLDHGFACGVVGERSCLGILSLVSTVEARTDR